MTDDQRERFDRLLQDVLDGLPASVRSLVEEVPVVVLDRPSPEMVDLLRRDGLLALDEDGTELCGLHSGIGLTERSIEDPSSWGADLGVPEHIHLFREGIAALALENLGEGSNWAHDRMDDELYEEIRVTLLHELGHHFGLEEDDLDQLGYT